MYSITVRDVNIFANHLDSRVLNKLSSLPFKKMEAAQTNTERSVEDLFARFNCYLSSSRQAETLDIDSRQVEVARAISTGPRCG
jgi:ABC-type branched-subunit amino acid transport system ATPase component